MAPLLLVTPVPDIAQPERRNQAELRLIGPAVDHANADEQVFRAGFGVINENVEVTVVIKDSGLHQLVFGLIAAAATVLFHQVLVGEFLLRVLVQTPHEAVGWGVEQVKEIVLEVFAVVALTIGQAKGPLFQDRVTAIPKGQAKTKQPLLITDAKQAILAPAITTHAGVVMGE